MDKVRRVVSLVYSDFAWLAFDLIYRRWKMRHDQLIASGDVKN